MWFRLTNDAIRDDERYLRGDVNPSAIVSPFLSDQLVGVLTAEGESRVFQFESHWCWGVSKERQPIKNLTEITHRR